MKNPMQLTIIDLAVLTAECKKRGVAFSWQMGPMVKIQEDETGQEGDQNDRD